MSEKKSDVEQFTENITEMTAEFQQMALDFMEAQNAQISDIEHDPMHFGETLIELTRYFSSHPDKMIEKQMSLWQDYMTLWENTSRKILGEDDVQPVIEPNPQDKRFRDKEWRENQIFDHIKQSYLLTAQWLAETADEIHPEEGHERDKTTFFTRQFIEAMSPTNFALTNPEVLRETLDSQGQNLVKGLENIVRDYNPETGKLKVTMTCEEKFEVGRNIGTTPGKVVFRNDLIELIQYTPTTDTQFQTPLLIIPPWINKFYILDLRPENSLVKWLTDKGYSVFIVSWRNPDASMAELGLEEYMRLGLLSAMEKVQEATGETRINTVGYCIGGTLLSCTLAHLAARGELDQVGCSTLLVSQVDFSEAGELTVFVDEEQVADMEITMEKYGYLDGTTMANTFNMLRANDLIWSFVINNYLKGKEPYPFDLLYWNADNTRLTRACHSQYLRDMYLHNNLVKPGAVTLGGTPLDLTRIDIPTYIQAAQTDHICPWKSVYKATRHFSGPRRFMLAGSGHIAGVVNPPSARKYSHLLNDALPEDPEKWLEGAVRKPGSWWDDWQDWLAPQSGEQVPARDPDDGPLPVLGDAPGSYVKVRY